MRILLDECVPRKLGQHLRPHSVTTVPQRGWNGIKNGELLRLASEEFDVFLTVDRGIPHQQRVATVNLAVVVIRTLSNDINDLLPLIPQILTAIESTPKGEVRFVSA
jgi:predicted nuclease of predicted toxin-antitoxin system